MNKYIVSQTFIPADHYDVIVCGGGPAGFCAAVRAAREGMRTALVERFSFLGGTATAGLVVPISEYYHAGKRIIGGIPWEFACRLVDLHAATKELPKGNLSFDPEYYKLCAQRMVQEAGVELYTNSYLSRAFHSDDDRVSAVAMETKSGTLVLEGDYFIDATGDADLFHLLELPMQEQTDAIQPVSLCFVLAGVDIHTPLLKNCIHHDGAGQSASVNTVIRTYLNGLLEKGQAPLFGGPWFNSLVTGEHLAVNITRCCADACDSRQITAAELSLREDMFQLFALLKDGFPEFTHAYIACSAITAGIRESRHIQGLYQVTGSDFLSGRSHPDTIAYSAHPMDIHIPDTSDQILKRLTHPGAIPYRSMLPVHVPNLIAAGRCICADRDAYASLRVQAPAMAMGEAAGAASALCFRQNLPVQQLSASLLRSHLDLPAELP